MNENNIIDFTNVSGDDEIIDPIEYRDFDSSGISISIDEKYIPKSELEKEDKAEEIFSIINNSFDEVKKNEELYNAISPKNNSYTKKLIDMGYTEEDALVMSLFCMMYMIYSISMISK